MTHPRPPDWRWWPACVGAVASSLVALLLAGAFHLWQGQSVAQWENRVQRSLSELRAQLEAELYGNLHLGTRLAAFVDGQAGPDATEFSEFAQALLSSGQHAVRYLAYAPEHTIRFVHPASGNQWQIGRQLSRDTVFAAEVSLLIRDRTVRVAGPLEPVPGARELVMQIPLNGGGASAEASGVSGQVNVSVDLEELYRRTDLYRFAEHVDLAIRIARDDGSVTLFGRESLLSASSVRTAIDFPGLPLELAAAPHGGWNAVEPVPEFIGPLAGLMLLAVFSATFKMTHQARRLRLSEACMRATSERLTTLLSAMPNLVSIVDREGHCTGLFGGHGASRALVDDGHAIGRTVHELLPENAARQLLAASRRARQEKTLQTIEFSITAKEAVRFFGTDWPEGTQWFRTTIAPLPDENGEVGSTLWITDSTTDERNAAAALERSHNRYRQLSAAVQQVVFETDPGGRIEFINPAWKQRPGADGNHPVGHSWISLIHPEDRDAMHLAFVELMTGRRDHMEQDVRLAVPGDQPFWVHAYLMPLGSDDDSRIRGAIGTLFDINDRKLNEKAIRHQALHDPLTGQPNRLLLIELLEQALARIRRQGSQLAVLYVDLDDFKLINDRHGHLVGDQVLRESARRLRGQVRDSDTVARIGGDEFVVLLDSICDLDAARQVASKLVAALGEPMDIARDGGIESCCIGASIGVAIAPGDGNSVDALLHHADLRLYRAKAAGKGGSHSTPT
jgi:diguanylate cyclase (GGDEF)-like protein/PAS domain S-box-containing protein